MKLPGDYVAGFVDGEGCFMLYGGMRRPGSSKAGYFNVTASFQIKLRADDEAILHAIRDTVGVGVVREERVYRGSHTQRTYGVTAISDLVAVVAFFRRHPLHARKRKDFDAWAEGIELLAEIQARVPARTAKPKGRTRWTEFDRVRVAAIAARVKAARAWGVR